MKAILIALLLLTPILNGAEVGMASHYSTKTGTRTASGQKLVDSKLTAAHRTLKFGTLIKVTNLSNKKTIIVVCNDRGPYIKGRIIDLTSEGAKQLGFLKQGVAKVKIEVVNKTVHKQ